MTLDEAIGRIKIEEARHAGMMGELLAALAAASVSPALPVPLPAPAAPITVAADVPYRSQWDDDAKQFSSDCGPACVGMLLSWRGASAGVATVAIDTLSIECGMGPNKRYTNDADLRLVAMRHGLGLQTVRGYRAADFVARAPSIALVHYGSIAGRMDVKYTVGHWVVVIGGDDKRVVYHDPDWSGVRRNEGARRSMTLAEFDRALADCGLDGNPVGYGLVVA